MEHAWCCSCKTVVPIPHADSNLPCPVCGGTWYVYVLDQSSKSKRMDNVEALMCEGKWEAAVDIVESMASSGEIAASDCTLYQALIDWRRQCATAAIRLMEEGCEEDQLLGRLLNDYDIFAASWTVENYKGLKGC